MPTIKLVVIGPSGVGKTSLRGQYISGRFSTGYRATIGADFISKTLPHPSSSDPADSMTLQIWDTAGQERFSSLSSAFFRGADAALLMFDVNQPATLHVLRKWWDEFRTRAPVSDEEAEAFCVVVVGNKIDIEGAVGVDRVNEEEAARFVDSLVPPSSSPASPIDPLPANGNDHLAPPPNDFGTVHTQTPSLDIITSKRLSPSRSRSSSRFFGGTMTSTHSYHTASSSLFDTFESARSSPVRSLSPPGSVRRRTKRGSGSSSSESALTITPSLYHANVTASTTPPTTTPPPEPEIWVLPPLSDLNPTRSPLPPPPLKRPKLFFASAKSGEGVSDVFEYVAHRVARQWEWEEAVEARAMHVQEASSDRISLGSGWRERGREMGSSCCSS